MKLIIGNKRYSSWSLRPWVLMKHFDISFEEILVPLDRPETREQILKYSPSGKVPALIDDKILVWDSLAIAEYLNEKFPAKKMWPQETAKRAHARSAANEMHSGFATMRAHMPHDVNSVFKGFDTSTAQEDIKRVQEIWSECLSQYGGPYLFGDFSIADAMYAPVVNRFVTYDVKFDKLDPQSAHRIQIYMDKIRTLPAHNLWMTDARSEELRMPRYEKK